MLALVKVNEPLHDAHVIAYREHKRAKAAADDHRYRAGIAEALRIYVPPDDVDRLSAQVQARERRPLDWSALASRTPPARDWAIDYWLGMGHVTLLAGQGGIGKSFLAQQIASALALGVTPFIDHVHRPLNVLGWFAEDEHDELWRRQARIAMGMGKSLDDFAGKLIIESFHDRDCTLAANTFNEFRVTTMLDELRQQVADYHADFVILDNVARMFGGNENDRHQVTRFVAELVGATAGAGVLLLGHIGRAAGSEFSGSSAWENAARGRLWLSDKLPDQQSNPDSEPIDGGPRYLSRRKSNYSARDVRTFRYVDGIFVADPSEQANVGGGLMDSIRRGKADRVILEAFRKLVSMSQMPGDGSTSPAYLPKLVLEYKLGEGLTKKELADAMRRMQTDGKLEKVQVGTYGNRQPRFGLREV